MYWMVDPRFRAARYWSNKELQKFAPKFRGSVINVSGWQDLDKEGGTYREDYFINAAEYWITNWKSSARGFQGDLPNEIYLDLEQDVPSELIQRFDVVFNHTTLEHVFDVFKAFGNLCALSRDIIVVVLPFLQEQHGAYGDYWRFTPWAVKRLFIYFGIEPSYINCNDSSHDAIYVMGIGAQKKESIEWIRKIEGNIVDDVEKICVGTKILDRQPILGKLANRFYERFFKSNNRTKF